MKILTKPSIIFFSMLFMLWTMVMLYPGYLFSQDGENNIQEPNRPTTFESFETIIERNIFDPNRRPARRREEPRPTRRPDPDEAVLTGTMITDDTAYAFFQGSNSNMRAVISTGNSYLGFDVQHVGITKVLLKNDERTLEIPVGMALLKEVNGDWKLSQPSGTVSRDSSISRSELSSSSTSDSTDNDEVQNDVLKRLMERRKQEAGQ